MKKIKMDLRERTGGRLYRRSGFSAGTEPRIKTRIALSLFLLFLLQLSLGGCIPAGEFYTGKTLRPGKFGLRFGGDDLLYTSSSKEGRQAGISIIPSVGMAIGLPLRFETDVRWFPVNFLEGTLREQLDPRSFHDFDASLNFSYGGYVGEYSYGELGATMSRNLKSCEPYVSFSLFHTVGRASSNLNLTYHGSTVLDVSDYLIQSINDARSLELGVGVPIGRTEIYPEVDYMYFTGEPSLNILSFGLGIQIHVN